MPPLVPGRANAGLAGNLYAAQHQEAAQVKGRSHEVEEGSKLPYRHEFARPGNALGVHVGGVRVTCD